MNRNYIMITEFMIVFIGRFQSTNKFAIQVTHLNSLDLVYKAPLAPGSHPSNGSIINVNFITDLS